MTWLIWKEYRLQLLVLGAGTVLLLVPYTFPLYSFLTGDPGMEWFAVPQMSIILSVLTLALLGGNAIAGERADRSAEFLAYQPVTRLQIVGSKLVLPFLAVMVVWGGNLMAFGVIRGPGSFKGEDAANFSLFIAAGVCAFGIAWLVSSFQSSPTFAAASGIISPILLLALIVVPIGVIVAYLEMDSAELILFTCFAALSLLVGALSLIGGIWIYLRRVEP